jgi:chromosome segregation ATPase
VTNNDQAIQEIIGMSYDLFTKIIVFSGNSIPFLMMPLAAQRGQIEELFNITLLTEKSIKLKEIIKTTEGSIAIAEAIIKEQEAQAALFKKQLTTAAARITLCDTDRTKNVNAMREQLELLKTVNMEDEKELHSFISECQKQQHNLNSKLLVAKKDRTSATADVKRLKDELHHLLDEKCPYCLQKYEGAAEKLVEKKDVLEKKEARLADLEAFISKTSSEVLALAAQITEAESLIKFPSYADAVKAETGATTAQSKINDLIDAINPHIEAHEQLKKHAINNVSHAEADELRKDVEHQQFLLRLLTDKNSFIRRRIINRTIPFLNNRLIHYTKEIGLPHIVKFDDDMSCTVSEYGRELDFGNLSSGEKKRVNLSLSLAFRDVLHHLHARVNCLFIDEIDASLDGAGVESVFRLLKQKSRDDGLGLWIISHRPEAVGRFDRTLLVRKENGFSSIITDEEMETA